MVKSIIAPSMLSCDFSQLGAETAKMLACGADWLHLDIMDGHFAPNLTIGPTVVQSLRKVTQGFLDCHCMVTNIEKWIQPLAVADQITFHYESVQDEDVAGRIKELSLQIKKAGPKVGIAISPKTIVTESMIQLFQTPGLFDLILVMTVEPGFGGQSFMPDMMDKVRTIRAACPEINIQVDGGITIENVEIAAQAGANVIVAGTGIFKHKDPTEAISIMRKAVDMKFSSQ